MANHQLGTYTYTYKATLVADPTKFWNITTLKILVRSDGCLITAKSVQETN